jgi:hypothetical protein
VACFRIGSASRPFSGIKLRGFAIDISGGSTSAVALSLTQIYQYDLSLRLLGSVSSSSQIGLKMDGTGSFTGDNHWSFISANAFSTCVQMNNESNNNFLFVLCYNGGATPVVLNSANGNTIYEDIENATGTANTIAANANNFHNTILCYCQGNRGTPKDMRIGAGASGNAFLNVGADTAEGISGITDNGSNNTFPDPYQFRQDPSGNIFLAPGRGLNYGRALSSGTAPTCSVMGAGASGTCAVAVGSTDSLGEITIGAAGAGTAAAGTMTINFSASLGTNRAICMVLPSANNTGWNARASFQQASIGTRNAVLNWDNNAIALVASRNYNVSYQCFGR